MLREEEPLSILKKEMCARKFEESFNRIIGSIVYFPTQKEINHEIAETNLENIDIGHHAHDKKKESLLDALTKLIHDYPYNNNEKIIPKVKCNASYYDLTIDTDLYDFDIDEIDYEKNIYFKKHKQCSPIKRNSFKIKKVFSENEETWL